MRTPCVFHGGTSPRPFLLVGATLFINVMAAGAAIGQEADRAIGAPERAAVIDGLVEKILKIYVYPDVAKQMEQAIRDRQAKKEYDTVSSGLELARVLTRHLRDVCKDDHLSVDFFAQGIPYDSEKKPDPRVVEEFRQSGMRGNYAFKKVERLEGGIGLLQVDGFYPAEWIAETAAGAMAFLANSESVILDLRQNSGGQSGGGLLCSYFFKEETHLTDFYNRPENTTRQFWSYPVAGAEKFADKDLYILTSRRTFSAAEGLAYDMQALKRATIVGEPTRGGAHGTTIYRITDHFSASIPFCRGINPATKTDWEGTGVKPDVAVPADQALLTAHLLALKKALTKYADKRDVADNLKRVIAGKEKELEALKTK
jgi:retinol-binding protein 3